jgi:hypothetical protein
MCHGGWCALLCNRGINLAVDHVVQLLKSRAKMISTTEEISQVSVWGVWSVWGMLTD